MVMKGTLPFMFYFVYFAASAFSQPFIILYYQELGFSGWQISILAAIIPLVVMISAPFWTGLADIKMRHKLIMSLTIVVSVLVSAVFPLVKSFALMIPLVFLFAFFIAPVISFADSATLSMLAEKKELYGRVRLGGTIGWGVFALVAGLVIETYGLRWAFWGFSLILIFYLADRQSSPLPNLENLNPCEVISASC
jgi:PPP family 3-phenylpropionic acid transporter